LELKQVQQFATTLPQKAVAVNGVHFLGAVVEAGNAEMLKQLALAVKDLLTAPYLAVLCANVSGKAQVTVLVDEQLVKEKGLNAQKIIKEQVAPLIKGGGGGQPVLASAGGQDAGQLEAVIAKVKALLG